MQRISAYKRLLASTVMLNAASAIIIMADRAEEILAGIVVLTAAYPLFLMSVRQLILRIVDSGLQYIFGQINDSIDSVNEVDEKI